MNESNNTGAAERGWGERGQAPARRFWLQARVEVRSRQPEPSEGGTEKGQRGWGETFRLPPAMCNSIAANPELLVFQMALGEAPLPTWRHVPQRSFKKLLGNIKRRRNLPDELIFSLGLTRQPTLPAKLPLASVEFANICSAPRPVEIHWSLSIDFEELRVSSSDCGMRRGVWALAHGSEPAAE